MNKKEEALKLFHQGCNCSQSVFAAFAAECGLERGKALALSAPFGAGLGRMREVCGAFSGLAMVCGAGTDIDGRGEVYELIQQLAGEFKKEFQSLYCRDLLGLAEGIIESPVPSERTEAYYKERPCERCIEFCAGLAERVLKEREP